MRSFVRRSLFEQVPRNQRDTDAALRRRQVVAVLVVLVGAIVLGLSLRIEPGNAWFYPATFGLAAVWAVGAFASGRLHLGRIAYAGGLRRPVVGPVVLGVLLVLLFVVGALVVRNVPFLADQVQHVLDHADQGSLPILVVITLVNGIAEELFFRGAAYAAIPSRPVVWTTVLYFVATLATGNVMLAFAAALLGAICGLQRRASGGILAPILTHVTWSLSMLFLLPMIFGGS